MGRSRRDVYAFLIMLLFLVLCLVGQSYGSSRHNTHQVLKVKPKSDNHHHNFFGFLPKGTPIPPSGPSRKHNSIGS
ncbi:Protein IDA-LIKE 2 [Senna tora]|uniref:Protein IDA-LIKE 2 n=1 Tax=Senna tora TaxID=362788 RepID=A0A834T065_9FABA|nr:Protein IDA-LIKE 2 [Senna tora]